MRIKNKLIRKAMICILCFFMVNLSACSKAKEETELIDAPEVYDHALSIEINPKFILYLHEGRVVSFTPANADAQKVAERAYIANRSLEEALYDIVRFSYEEGFLKDNDEIKIKIITTYKPEEEAKYILDSAKNAINSSAKECNIKVNPIVNLEMTIMMTSQPGISEGPDQGLDEQDQGPQAPQTPQPSDTPNDQPAADQKPQTPVDQNDPKDDDPNANTDTPSGDDPEHHEPAGVELCPVCGGTGTCDRCLGEGKVICDECGGTGYDVCSKCHGSGVAGGESYGPKTCDQCSGSGKIVHGNCEGTGYKTCQTCKGLGTCTVCHGTGLNPHE